LGHTQLSKTRAVDGNAASNNNKQRQKQNNKILQKATTITITKTTKEQQKQATIKINAIKTHGQNGQEPKPKQRTQTMKSWLPEWQRNKAKWMESVHYTGIVLGSISFCLHSPPELNDKHICQRQEKHTFIKIIRKDVVSCQHIFIVIRLYTNKTMLKTLVTNLKQMPNIERYNLTS